MRECSTPKIQSFGLFLPEDPDYESAFAIHARYKACNPMLRLPVPPGTECAQAALDPFGCRHA